MSLYASHLNWIDNEKRPMLGLLRKWAGINSHSFNLSGLGQTANSIIKAFSPLEAVTRTYRLPKHQRINGAGKIEQVPLGKALYFQKRPQANRQALLVCHMDTVYGQNKPVLTKGQRVLGPGVTDAKGGIVVMLKALQAFEKSSYKNKLGWQVLINPDEEIGSPGSASLLKKLAKSADVGLVYEPCLPNGNLVGERKGSGNFTLIIRGRSAHAGRDFFSGRNAIVAAAACVTRLNALSNPKKEITVNVGKIDGGGAVNVVPELAIVRFNIRLKKNSQQKYILGEVRKIIQAVSKRNGVKIRLSGKFSAPPKNLDKRSLRLFKQFKSCGKTLGMDIHWQPSGGVCDGNRLAAEGLPTVDTLGVRGGNLHSPQEYMDIDSLVKRAKLSALFLMRFANGEY